MEPPGPSTFTGNARTVWPPTSTRHSPCPSSTTFPDSRLLSPMNWATNEFPGSSYSWAGVASCSIRPWRNTAIRSDIVSASL